MTIHRFRVRLTTGEWRSAWLHELPMSCGCEGDLKDWLAETLPDCKPEDIEDCRYIRKNRCVSTQTLKLKRNLQSYGGPEEGGWWRDSFELIREFTVTSKYADRARYWLEKYAEAQNVGLSQFERDERVYVSSYVSKYPPLPDSNHYC